MQTLKTFIASLFSRKFLMSVAAFVEIIRQQLPPNTKLTGLVLLTAVYSAANIWEQKQKQ